MNWDDLAHKRIPAPFVPKIKGELDVSNFSDEFTTMVPADSPAIVPVNSEKLFKVGSGCVKILNRQRESHLRRQTTFVFNESGLVKGCNVS